MICWTVRHFVRRANPLSKRRVLWRGKHHSPSVPSPFRRDCTQPPARQALLNTYTVDFVVLESSHWIQKLEYANTKRIFPTEGNNAGLMHDQRLLRMTDRAARCATLLGNQRKQLRPEWVNSALECARAGGHTLSVVYSHAWNLYITKYRPGLKGIKVPRPTPAKSCRIVSHPFH